jgi:hypothetical protein
MPMTLYVDLITVILIARNSDTEPGNEEHRQVIQRLLEYDPKRVAQIAEQVLWKSETSVLFNRVFSYEAGCRLEYAELVFFLFCFDCFFGSGYRYSFGKSEVFTVIGISRTPAFFFSPFDLYISIDCFCGVSVGRL